MSEINTNSNSNGQPAVVVVVDEFAQLGKSLEGNPDRERILEAVQKYESRKLRQRQYVS